MTGSRHFTDTDCIKQALDAVIDNWHDREIVLVCGGADGADELAARYWEHLGREVETHEAQWKVHGRGAGIIRNALMIDLGADLCIAFYDQHQNKGTRNCAYQANRAGIPLREYKAESTAEVNPSTPQVEYLRNLFDE